MNLFKALKGQIDQNSLKLVLKLSFYYKLCNFVSYYIIRVILLFPCRHHTPGGQSIALKSVFLKCRQGVSIGTWSQKILFDLGNVFIWLKYGKAAAAASRSVVLFYLAFGVKFHSEIVDSISNESSKSALQDAHEYYWVQIPYW